MYLPDITPTARKVLFEARNKLEKSLVTHAHFNDALAVIRNRILFPADSNLLFIVGPSGVGKTRLFATAQKMILETFNYDLIEDKTRLPCVAFEVQATNVGNFAWGPFYNDYQAQLQVPLAPSKEMLTTLPKSPRQEGPQQAVLSAISHRRPLVTFLDEANHLCQVSNARLLPQQLDKIKSLANQSKTLHVMFGTYELAALLDASPQLARRGNTHHFSRYRWERQKELNDFTGMVKCFGQSIPLHHTLNLESRVQYFYERTIGCGGILKNWLMEALGYACRNNRTYITMDDLNATAIPSQKLRRLLIEAQNKESLLDYHDNDSGSLLEMLPAPFVEQTELQLQAPAPRSNKHSPGTPNPRSDPTGGAFRNDLAVARASL